MEIVKYFTPATFKKEKFVDILRYQMNVAAGVADDGVYIDREAFAKTSNGPKWVEMNREDIMSELHTRVATKHEIFRLLHPAQYQVTCYVNGEWLPLVESNSLDQLKACVDGVSKADSVAIIDITTGEVVYEVEL